MTRVSLQRLFSTFANGWPGAGILLQRGLAGSILLYYSVLQVLEKPHGVSMVPAIIGAVAGLFLLVGLWTPVAGTAASAVQVWLIHTGRQEPLVSVTLATVSTTIAMIGPGAWSVDARIFGRKHIETRVSPKSSDAPHH